MIRPIEPHQNLEFYVLRGIQEWRVSARSEACALDSKPFPSVPLSGALSQQLNKSTFSSCFGHKLFLSEMIKPRNAAHKGKSRAGCMAWE